MNTQSNTALYALNALGEAIVEGDPQKIADAWLRYGVPATKKSQSDAALSDLVISAAPEMYDALEEAEKALRHMDDLTADPKVQDALEYVKSALAKARGEEALS